MKVKEFLNLLLRQAILKYELEFSGFTDKQRGSRNCEHYSESSGGWKTVIKNCWKRCKRIIENYSIKEVSIEAFFCFTRKQTFY